MRSCRPSIHSKSCLRRQEATILLHDLLEEIPNGCSLRLSRGADDDDPKRFFVFGHYSCVTLQVPIRHGLFQTFVYRLLTDFPFD